MTPHPVDGHWLDFYALLGVPAGAGEDAIRKRIGKVYSEAAANSDHRDLARRHYFQALLERVLPQCRRVLLDAQWRGEYDRQHLLNQNGDPAAQNYVAFIASMRGQFRGTADEDPESLPQRVQEDILLAREVVECACQGAQLELLPSQSVSSRDAAPRDTAPAEAKNSAPKPVAPGGEAFSSPFPIPENHPPDGDSLPVVALEIVAPKVVAPKVVAPKVVAPKVVVPEIMAPAMAVAKAPTAVPSTLPVAIAAKVAPSPVAVAPISVASPAVSTPAVSAAQAAPVVEEIVQRGAALHAQVISAEQAAVLRRERVLHSRRENSVEGRMANLSERSAKRNAPVSRISVGDAPGQGRARAISSTSLHLMVAITGVLLTITVQHFSGSPAIANSGARTPIFVAATPEMESALHRAETAWEQTPGGSRFDLVVQSTDSRAGLSRALGAGAALPDVWIPSDTSWVERYNQRAPRLKRQIIGGEQPLAQSPMVLIARGERAGALRKQFPQHQITSWQALRDAIMRDGAGHLGLSNPQKTASGALARVSMAREWGAKNGMSPALAAKSPAFWAWMAGFEDNAPSASARTADMVKDMAQNTTGRFWWVVAYESDALQWMQAGKKLEIFYLPRTTYANHPFCSLERVGASGEISVGRADFEKFLRSQASQKALLNDGFRPTEVNLKTRLAGNPFSNADFRARGARVEGLPLEERANTAATEIVAQQWAKRYG